MKSLIKYEEKENLLNPDKATNAYNLFGLSKEYGANEYSVKHDELDNFLYNTLLEKSKFRTEIDNNKSSYPTIDKLSQDMFNLLFKAEPLITDKLSMNPAYNINNQIIRKFAENKEVLKNRKYTIGDNLNSLLGVSAFSKEALNIYTELLKQEEQDNKVNMNIPNTIAAPNNANTNSLIKTVLSLQSKADKGKLSANDTKSLENLKKILNQRNNTNASTIDKSIGDGIKNISEELDRNFQVTNQWGLNSAELERVPFQNKKEAISILLKSQKLKDMADIVGRLREVARQCQISKSKTKIMNPIDVNTGNDLANVLQSEKGLLANKDTEDLFIKKFSEKQLLQYENDNDTELGKGPIIACLDISGSMRGAKEQWSKALAVALYEIARRQERSFACVMFDSKVKKSIYIPKNTFDAKSLLDICELTTGGGTLFEPPLEKALNIITTDKDYKKADVMFLTDGESNVADGFLKNFLYEKERHSFKVISVVIGRNYDAVEKFSDKVNNITDFDIEGKGTTGNTEKSVLSI